MSEFAFVGRFCRIVLTNGEIFTGIVTVAELQELDERVLVINETAIRFGAIATISTLEDRHP